MVDDKAQVLRHSPIFSGLDDEEIAEVAAAAVLRTFEPGAFVLREGDAPVWFHTVARGRVKVFKTSSTGREFIIAFFGPGEMFGEVAVFENGPYPASAQTVDETVVVSIRREDFLALLARRPDMALKAINVLGGRLRDSQGRLRDLAGERAEQRVARILLMLHARLGQTLPFTRQEIADMAGIAPETAIRIMSRLRSGGIIRSLRGKTIVLDETKLRLLSEGPPAV